MEDFFSLLKNLRVGNLMVLCQAILGLRDARNEIEEEKNDVFSSQAVFGVGDVKLIKRWQDAGVWVKNYLKFRPSHLPFIYKHFTFLRDNRSNLKR